MLDTKQTACIWLACLMCVFFLYLVHANRTPCDNVCEWTQWEAWTNDCKCGFANLSRSRSRGLCCKSEHNIFQCLQYCGFGPVGYGMFSESDKCQPVCYNGGIILSTGCECTKRYYGFCCEKRVDICEAVAADVIFVLDSSVSQTEEQFKKQLEFVERFVDKFTVNTNAFQIAVLTFSTEVCMEIDFDDRLTKDDIKSKIRFRPGATFTDKGLAMARTMHQSRGNRLLGLPIEKFTFVFTDGMSTDRNSTADKALSLRYISTVVVVGIGQMVSHEELQKIASQPDEFTLSYVFSVQNFDSLHTLINRLIDATCGKCSKSSRTDIIALIDDLSSSAMTSTEFSSALNGIAYILQHLASYGKVNGQRVGVLHVDGIDNKSLPLSHSLNMDQLLSYVQGIRKYSHTCSLTFYAASRSRNISTAINEAILTNFVNADSKARKVLLVLTSGRFDNVDAVWKEVGAITLETGVYVFAIGAGYESNINGLQAIAQEPSNVFMVSDDNLETLDVIQSQLSYISCS